MASQDQTASGTLVIDFTPALSDKRQGEFLDAVYSVAFQPLVTQIRLLNEAVMRARLAHRNAVVHDLKGEAEAQARNMAALLLMRDLLQMGWSLSLRGPIVQLSRRPLDEDINVAKAQVRKSMGFERQESLSNQSVKDFVRSMERQRLVDGRARNIFSLMGDSTYLANTLEPLRALSRDERSAALGEAIRPYLQLVEGEDRDIFTGLRLIDIWRYFRLTWSTPYRSTPGRNLFYLVRDAGQPCHPVMGIAALANCVIGLKCRDDRIGWTPDAIAERLMRAKKIGDTEYQSEAWSVASLLEAHLKNGIESISIDGITSRNTVTFPTAEAIEELEKIAAEAAEDRYEYLRQEAALNGEDNFDLVAPEPDTANGVTREQRESSAALFRRKRASKLAALLRAKLICQQKGVFDNAPSGLPELLWTDRSWHSKADTSKSEAGRSALRTILNANKETKIGSAMMEIIVCGAVEPYNYLLGGKLVAMLLASPQVVRDYERRYNEQSSTIASQIAGREVTRTARLVYLGTSSLYVGSRDVQKFDLAEGTNVPRPSSASQYNRIRIPAEVAGGHGDVRYECIGMTEGFGVVHFSADTRQALEELDFIAFQARRVSSLFGEGTSPRMRKIRQGISLLGLDDRFLVHGQPRLVYSVRLAHNTEAYLMGEDREPNYIFPTDDPERASTAIASYWIRRWLSGRLDHRPALSAIAMFEPTEAALSREFTDDSVNVPDLGL